MPETTPVTPATTRRPFRSRLDALVALLAVGLAAVVVPGSPAAADPIAEKRAEAERLAQDIEAQERELSVLDERANQARLAVAELDEARRRVEAELADARARVVETKDRLRQVAVEAYVGGGPLSEIESFLDTDAGDMVVRNGYLQATAARQREVIAALHAAEQDLTATQAELDENRTEAAAAADQAVAAAEQAEQVLAEHEATRQRVQGELAELVAEEQRRRAEEESRRVRARLEAERQAREEAARRAAEEASRRSTQQAPAPRAPSGPVPVDGPAPPPAAGASAAVAEARRQLGKPYEWGADGPDSFDCSGLTQWAWRAGGVSLPHSSQAQWNVTTRVPVSAVQPGDLVFFGRPIHHVGIYVGDGQMIAAPHTGSHVKYQTIYRSDLVGVGRPR